jgi:hypothetical protein
MANDETTPNPTLASIKPKPIPRIGVSEHAIARLEIFKNLLSLSKKDRTLSAWANGAPFTPRIEKAGASRYTVH